MSAEKQAIAQSFAHFNSGNLAECFKLYDERVVLHGYGPKPIGFDGCKASYTGLKNAFPDGNVVIEEAVQEGDKVAIIWAMTGTHKNEFMKIPATGRSIVLKGHSVFRFAGGKVVERWNTGDVISLLIQLGAFTPPG